MDTVVLARPDEAMIEVDQEEDLVVMHLAEWKALKNATRAALNSGLVADDDADVLKRFRVANFHHELKLEESDAEIFEVEDLEDPVLSAQWFARALTEKFPEYTFFAMPGSVNVRIVRDDGREQIAYCFVRKQDGGVYKAASWTAPSKDRRYSNVQVALRDADPHNAVRHTRKATASAA